MINTENSGFQCAGSLGFTPSLSDVNAHKKQNHVGCKTAPATIISRLIWQDEKIIEFAGGKSLNSHSRLAEWEYYAFLILLAVCLCATICLFARTINRIHYNQSVSEVFFRP